MNKKISYTDAFEELQEITSQIEAGNIGVDDLLEKVKRGSLLIKICKEKLSTTEENVQEILKELNQKDQ